MHYSKRTALDPTKHTETKKLEQFLFSMKSDGFTPIPVISLKREKLLCANLNLYTQLHLSILLLQNTALHQLLSLTKTRDRPFLNRQLPLFLWKKRSYHHFLSPSLKTWRVTKYHIAHKDFFSHPVVSYPKRDSNYCIASHLRHG